MEKTNDQSVEKVAKEGDQSSEQKSDETEKEEPLNPEQLTELAKGLQKGYTLTRQEISEMKENLQSIADNMNKQTGAETGNDEYLTVGKLKEVLAQYDTSKAQQEAANKAQIDKAIEDNLSELEADGIISSPKERESLIQYAVDNRILDLNKAAAKWLKEQGKAKIDQVVKAKAKQEEGSQIGTSSKTTGEESRGINYDDIVRGVI